MMNLLSGSCAQVLDKEYAGFARSLRVFKGWGKMGQAFQGLGKSVKTEWGL